MKILNGKIEGTIEYHNGYVIVHNRTEYKPNIPITDEQLDKLSKEGKCIVNGVEILKI